MVVMLTGTRKKNEIAHIFTFSVLMSYDRKRKSHHPRALPGEHRKCLLPVESTATGTTEVKLKTMLMITARNDIHRCEWSRYETTTTVFMVRILCTHASNISRLNASEFHCPCPVLIQQHSLTAYRRGPYNLSPFQWGSRTFGSGKPQVTLALPSWFHASSAPLHRWRPQRRRRQGHWMRAAMGGTRTCRTKSKVSGRASILFVIFSSSLLSHL